MLILFNAFYIYFDKLKGEVKNPIVYVGIILKLVLIPS